jgi:molecular chaperone IbpA
MSLKLGGYAMRTFDLAPLYRSTVGFDRLFSLLDQASGFEGTPGYPPYNIERTGENDYRISIAVAGFGQDELTIEAKENTLTVRGEKQEKQENNKGEVLYQGIAARTFERVFQLADFVQVKAAALENGLLHVDLVRERKRPAARRPRARDSGSEEAAQYPDREWRAESQGDRRQGRLSLGTYPLTWKRPGFPGRFFSILKD